jgi:hypothetical protein
MKQIKLKITAALTFLALTASSLPLYAGEPIATTWNQVCSVAAGRELIVTTSTGEAVEGFCVKIDVNEISVTTRDHRVVKIARNAFSRIEMHRVKGHQLRSLGEGVRGGLRWGFGTLLSPLVPVAVVAIPATLAWGAVAAPFCLLGDLKAKASGTQEIKPS